MTPATKVIVVHGPRGCGKTRRAHVIAKHFGCERIVDGWEDDPRPEPIGTLLLTCMGPDAIRAIMPRAEIVAFESMKFTEVERAA